MVKSQKQTANNKLSVSRLHVNTFAKQIQI